MNMANAYMMKKKSMGMAKGGMMDEEESGYDSMPEARDKMNMSADMEDEDMLDRIMAKHYSKGGRVANEDMPTADFEENSFDDLANRDDLESSYTGENSGDDIGNRREDEDREDIVSRIMRMKRMKPGRNPNPA